MGTVFLFAFTAALSPTLLAATTVVLLLPNPKRLLIGFRESDCQLAHIEVRRPIPRKPGSVAPCRDVT
jgi:hypothetical protein